MPAYNSALGKAAAQHDPQVRQVCQKLAVDWKAGRDLNTAAKTPRGMTREEFDYCRAMQDLDFKLWTLLQDSIQRASAPTLNRSRRAVDEAEQARDAAFERFASARAQGHSARPGRPRG
jgi:hypothetical protein